MNLKAQTMKTTTSPRYATLLGLTLLFSAPWALAQTSCAAAKPEGATPVKIVTSFYPMYIATLNVTKGVPGVEVLNLAKPQTGCLHDYQMTTEDMTHLLEATVFVVNGAGMESFLDKVVAERPALKIVRASEGIELIKGGGGEGDNPHIWVSVSLHIRQVENIAAQLAQADAVHADQYRKNGADYVARLEQLRQKMHDGLKDVQTRDIITFHEAFPYFAKEFNLRIAAVIEREPGSQPGARELARTIGIVRKAKVKALFAEPQYPTKAADAIARESGGKVYSLDPGVTGPMKADAYIEIMENNLAELRKALNRSSPE
jgi:zinc transport system substrate-binding protein